MNLLTKYRIFFRGHKADAAVITCQGLIALKLECAGLKEFHAAGALCRCNLCGDRIQPEIMIGAGVKYHRSLRCGREKCAQATSTTCSEVTYPWNMDAKKIVSFVANFGPFPNDW
jgi:hypothetical protein